MSILMWLLLILMTLPFSLEKPQIPAARQKELTRFVRHDCGSCHGMTLKGGLGPSLLPQALASKSEAELSAIILGGRQHKGMPPWAGILEPKEVLWLSFQLKEGIQ